MDVAWWKKYLADIKQNFRGDSVTCNAKVVGARIEKRMPQSRNSGEGAVALAAHYGAKKIILLGYDCQHTAGKKHWHDDHPKGLGNAGSVGKWAVHFQELAARLVGVEILNATRETALEQWPKVSLEEALQ